MKNNTVIIQDFQQSKEERYRNFVMEISSTSTFYDDVWECNKLRRTPAQRASDLKLKFRLFPEPYKDSIKYFAIINLMGGNMLSTVINKLQGIIFLCDYAFEIKIKDVTIGLNNAFAQKFKKHLDLYIKSEDAKRRRWCIVNEFYSIFTERDNQNPFATNPFKFILKSPLDEKYVPDYVTVQTDRIFTEYDISTHQKLIYWILRLIPSRVSEICGIELNCLNMFNGKYVLFIPTWKQNGGYKQAQIRTIYLEYSGKAKVLIDLIRQQQELAQSYQRYLVYEKRGLLLTYLKEYEADDYALKYTVAGRNINIITKEYVNRMFEKICVKYDVKDKNGNPYHLTSHQFRHNGITDRLEYGFTPEQVRLMTEHQGTGMILHSYNHTNLNVEGIMEKQKSILGEETSSKAMFKGRILGMDESIEERILKNIRTQRIRGGICSDITGCECEIPFCSECSYFIPEAEQLPYFEEQVAEWKHKLERFSNFPIVVNNAKRNIHVYQAIINKINRIIGGECIEKTSR